MIPGWKLFRRAKNSAVVWAWGVNAMRLGSGILLLPILLKALPKPEFGMYFVS